MENSKWIRGPGFLWQPQEDWPMQPIKPKNIDIDDPEVKNNLVVGAAKAAQNPVFCLLQKYSSWYRMKRAVAHIIKLKQLLHANILKHQAASQQPTGRQTLLQVEDLKNAEEAIVKYTQVQAFPSEVKLLSLHSDTATVHRNSPLYRLSPMMHNGIIVVGGRLHHVQPVRSCHQAILPSKYHVTEVIIRQIHISEGHQGRQRVLACLRENYWVINANASVRRVLLKCIQCRRL